MGVSKRRDGGKENNHPQYLWAVSKLKKLWTDMSYNHFLHLSPRIFEKTFLFLQLEARFHF